MAGEKPAGNPPANPGGGNKGPSKNNRRRSLRSKRRGGRKPEEGGEAREPREVREAREPRVQSSAPKAPEKNLRDNRDRRRRRRMRARQRGQNETPTPVVEDALKDLPPLVPSFVYTHVLRPAMRDSFEFRTEHFSKVTRRLEDFHIDLSPLYPEGGDEIKGVAYMPPRTEGDTGGDEDFDEDEEGYDDPDWDAEQSEDAAQLDGGAVDVATVDVVTADVVTVDVVTGVDVAISDDFYAEMDDSVVDEYPEEDIDA